VSRYRTAVLSVSAAALMMSQGLLAENQPAGLEPAAGKVVVWRPDGSGTMAARSVVLPALAKPPAAEPGGRKWRNAWLASVAALAAANAADVASSRNLAEQNPFLRNGQGGFDARKGVFIKAGATGGLLALQFVLRKRAGNGSLDKSFTAVNGVAAGVVGATAARNFGIERR